MASSNHSNTLAIYCACVLHNIHAYKAIAV